MNERAVALEEGDNLRYARLCIEEGIEPEFPDICNDGLAEIIIEEQRLARDPYSGFVIEADTIGVDMGLGKDRDKKIELLTTYFPGQFGKDGRQPIDHWDSSKVGVVFGNIYSYAKKG